MVRCYWGIGEWFFLGDSIWNRTGATLHFIDFGSIYYGIKSFLVFLKKSIRDGALRLDVGRN